MPTEEIFKAIPTLETKHYELRGLTVEDADKIFPFMRDKETMKFITPTPLKSIEAMEKEIKTQIDSFANQKEIPWVIIDKARDTLVGTFSLYKLSLWHKKADTGVVIRDTYQHKGVMTEIFPKILAFGFKTLGLNRIVGDIFAGNQGSKKLLEKFGFIKEGILRQTDFDGERYHDTVVYSLLKMEYESQE